MEHINGYDEYEDDFKSVARPEYKWLAEQMLTESLEANERQTVIELYMPDYISNDNSGYTFRFQQQERGNLTYTSTDWKSVILFQNGSVHFTLTPSLYYMLHLEHNIVLLLLYAKMEVF